MFLIFLCMLFPSFLFSMEIENNNAHEEKKYFNDHIDEGVSIAEFTALIESEDFAHIEFLIKSFREVKNPSPEYFAALKNYKNEDYRQALCRAFEINFPHLYKLNSDYIEVFKSKIKLEKYSG